MSCKRFLNSLCRGNVIVAIAIGAIPLVLLLSQLFYTFTCEEKRLDILFSCKNYQELIALCADEVSEEKHVIVNGNEYRVMIIRPAKCVLFESSPIVVFDKNGMRVDCTSGFYDDPNFRSKWLSCNKPQQDVTTSGEVQRRKTTEGAENH